LPGPRTVRIKGALEAEVVLAAELARVTQAVAVTIDAALYAEKQCLRPRNEFLADVGGAVGIHGAQLPWWARAHIAARAPAVDAGLAEIQLAVLAVVDTTAIATRLRQGAAALATGNGSSTPALGLLGVLLFAFALALFLLGDPGEFIQPHAETEGSGEESAQGTPP
jgi:hypothetical protein